MSPRTGSRRGGAAGLGTIVAIVTMVASLAACRLGTTAYAGSLTIGDPWVLVSGGQDLPAAGYLTITNATGVADALLSASSPGAASVELHQSAMESGGMVGMHPVDRLDVPAGGTVALAPGGYHLMIMGLRKALKAGDRLEIDLVFDHVGTIVVQAEVRAG